MIETFGIDFYIEEYVFDKIKGMGNGVPICSPCQIFGVSDNNKTLIKT